MTNREGSEMWDTRYGMCDVGCEIWDVGYKKKEE
jgi:hypothetical protein